MICIAHDIIIEGLWYRLRWRYCCEISGVCHGFFLTVVVQKMSVTGFQGIGTRDERLFEGEIDTRMTEILYLKNRNITKKNFQSVRLW